MGGKVELWRKIFVEKMSFESGVEGCVNVLMSTVHHFTLLWKIAEQPPNLGKGHTNRQLNAAVNIPHFVSRLKDAAVTCRMVTSQHHRKPSDDHCHDFFVRRALQLCLKIQ